MSDGPLELRVFGLDVAVNVQPERRDDVARQWSWCLPDAPSQRTIASLPGTPRQVVGTESIETEPSARSSGHNPSDTSQADEPTANESTPIVVDRIADTAGGGVDTGDYALTTTLTGRAIAARAGELVMLHAGGVCDPETGVVAGLVAASGTGKTTATCYYCTHGYGYVTDETLVFNDERAVLPYPKPLSVLVDPQRIGAKTQHCPDDLGMAPPRGGDLRLGPLILLDRIRDDAPSAADASTEADAPSAADASIEADGTTVDDASSTDVPAVEPAVELTEMPLFEALTMILPQSSAMPQIDGCLDLLARIAVAGGGVQRLRYREIADTLPMLRRAFEAEPQEPFWRHVPGTWWAQQPPVDPYLPPTVGSDDAASGAPGPSGDEAHDASAGRHEVSLESRLTLAPFVDALVDAEALEVLTLLGSTPAHLGGLGAVIHMTLLDGPRTLEQLVAACTRELGEHPDAVALVTRAAYDLLSNGVVRVVAP